MGSGGWDFYPGMNIQKMGEGKGKKEELSLRLLGV